MRVPPAAAAAEPSGGPPASTVDALVVAEDEGPPVAAEEFASGSALAWGTPLAADVADVAGAPALPPDEAPDATVTPAPDAAFIALDLAAPDAPATPTSLALCACASESGNSSAGEFSRSLAACHAK